LDTTPKREYVPDDLLYKCVNLQKFMEVWEYLFQGTK
jgi:hypothetical protein